MAKGLVARARSEGIETKGPGDSEAKPPVLPIRWAAMCAAAATVLIASFFAMRNAKVLPFIGKDKQTSAHLSSPPPVVRAEPVQTEDARLREQLTATRAELSSMSATVRAQRGELESVSKNSSSLNSRLTEAQQQAAALQTQRADRKSVV